MNSGTSGSASVRFPPPGISNFTAWRPGTFGEGAALGSVAFWLFHGVDLNPSSPSSSDHAAPVDLPFASPRLPVPELPEPAELSREGAVLVVVGASEAEPVDERVEPGPESAPEP